MLRTIHAYRSAGRRCDAGVVVASRRRVAAVGSAAAAPLAGLALAAAELAVRVVAHSMYLIEDKGVDELIDLKGYAQMVDFEDFRFPYRFEKLYSAGARFPYRFETCAKMITL